MINLNYPNILSYIGKYIGKNPKRTESAAFLIWYLENYYRLDNQDAIDSVCDQRGNKGIDGIFLNEGEETIDVFQARIHTKKDKEKTIGDTALKEFYGTLSQFKNKASLAGLINTAGKAQVGGLVERLDLLNKLEAYDIRGFFISNTEIDANGEAYLKMTPNIEFIGKNQLENSYIFDSRQIEKGKKAIFDITGFSVSKYSADENTLAIIAPIKAKELAELDGIENQSLFSINVRGPLGSTKVNRDIVKSIRESSVHKNFPLFHNGITIICDKLTEDKKKIQIETYYVVNGCQSLTALYQNRQHITDDLRILTKFVQVNVDTPLSERITRYSNNQNGVRPRDFRSNHHIQIRLQNEVNKFYSDKYFFEIKEGELTEGKEVISNEMTGIYLWSFDLKEPWNTHRKYQVFEDKHANLFARPEVNADRIVMLHEVDKLIKNQIPTIKNELFGKYALTRYTILYILRQIFEYDTAGKRLLTNPSNFVRSNSHRVHFINCVKTLIKDIIVDLNAEVESLGEDFDYKSKLRNEDWVKKLSQEIIANYLKLTGRRRIKSFQEEWEGKPENV